MRAVVAERAGPPEVLRLVELPDPEPGVGQVLVAVSVAATTFIDAQLRAGRGPKLMGPEGFPAILGNGVVGTVARLGAEVDAGWLGVRVVTSTGGRGGYASRAVARATDLHRIPEPMSDQDAVAVLADGRTALSLAGAAAIEPDDVVVVTAAAGGVGSLLVQLSAQAGAFVVALAGSDAKRTRARDLGAHLVLDSNTSRWATALDAAVDHLDVVFDGVGGAMSTALAERAAGGSRYVQHGAASGSFGAVDGDDLAARAARLITLLDLPADPGSMHRLVEDALRRVAVGELQPTIGLVLPLEHAAAAHAAMEARAVVGKTLLVL